MFSQKRESATTQPASSFLEGLAAPRLRFHQIMLLSVWCGLVAGLLEVAAVLLRKSTFDYNHLYWMSRQFIWLTPVATTSLLLVMGTLLAIFAAWNRASSGDRIVVRVLGLFTFLPSIWTIAPRIHGIAGFLLAAGLAFQVASAIERRRTAGFLRFVRLSLPVAAGSVAIMAMALWRQDRARLAREQSRPLPDASAASVLLIVLDTVRADHLSLQGYDRATSPTLDELSKRGIRFAAAQAPSSWTLTSHSSFFTGRWPHELSCNWFTPLDRVYPTLAEFAGSLGYATAGFVANTWYCGRDSGLSRGFATYRDYIFPRLTVLKSTALVDRTIDGLQSFERLLEDGLDFDLLRPFVEQVGWLFKINRKDAGIVNQEFLDWLDRGRAPDRPFFAFLNFYDAHYPYELTPAGIHRFSARPRTGRDSTLLRDWPQVMQNRPTESQIAQGRDAYDDCIADLDEHLGQLLDQLARRSLLENTWIVITADHGESFGENHGVFWHGTSLYQRSSTFRS